MKKRIAVISVFFLCCCLSSIAYAWVESLDVTVKSLYQWNGSTNIGIRLSNEKRCYFPQSEVRFHSIATGLYLTGKSADVHCYENETKNIGGIEFHKLHRIIAK